MPKEDIYTVGGTVQAGSGLYIPRKADEQLLALCREGEFAYVLTPRQLGKSSLVVSSAERLAKEDIQSVIIDLSGMGVKLSHEAWYLGLLDKIEESLGLETKVVNWWREHSHLGMTQRLTEFLERVVLTETRNRVVIFVDEIDTTLSLDFTDDFFAAIRYFYNARSRAPELKRLSFVLIGVAAPADLIRDERRTPFNIGKRVSLTDFTMEEALPLASGLGLSQDKARAVLALIMKWTKGHPYLTQRLCQAAAERRRTEWSEADVDRLVAATFFNADSGQDNNLQFVRDMLTERSPDKTGVLNTYREIRLGKKAVLDEEQSVIKNHLKLSGAVCREKVGDFSARPNRAVSSDQGVLTVRNRIYHQAFDEAWVKEHMPVNWLARIRESGVLIVAILLLFTIGFSVWAVRDARRKTSNALKDAQEARIKTLEAQKAEQLANDNLNAILQGDAKSFDYTEYQKNGDYREYQQNAAGGVMVPGGDNNNPPPSMKQPVLTQTIYDTPEKGSLKFSLYQNDSVLVTRKAPPPRLFEINTWISKLPKRIERAPGPILSDNQPRPDDRNSVYGTDEPQLQPASFTESILASTEPAGRCVDPHPGPFKSWYGEKNGCWVAVWRQWPDGCTHYQWFNACNNYWDVYPNGAPKVYWTNCVH